MLRLARLVCLSLASTLALATAAALGAQPSEEASVGALALTKGSVPATTPVVAPRSAVVVRAAKSARGWSDQHADLANAATVLDRGLSPAVVAAYTSAVLAAPNGCHLPVSLLAGLGQVESGNLATHRIDAGNRVQPAIFGQAGKGTKSHPVRDTDEGQWDGDAARDRTMGPLHLLPAVWRVAGVDMDRDGTRDPQNIHDAAGAVMVQLCAPGRDLATDAGMRQAVLAVNPSRDYLRLVLAWTERFEKADLAVSAMPLTFASWALPPETTATVAPVREVRQKVRQKASAPVTSSAGSKSSATPATPTRGLPVEEKPTSTQPGAPTPSPRPSKPATPPAAPKPDTKPRPADKPKDEPKDKPAEEPVDAPTCPLPEGVLTPESDQASATPAPVVEAEACVLAIDPLTGLPYVDPATGLPQTLPAPGETPAAVPSPAG